MTTELKLNGKLFQLETDPNTPLLWVIRDVVGLTGTKFSCGAGLCGACMIHINGVATRSCITPLSDAVGKEVTTIEGLSVEGDHPLQLAWQELNVSQCGYCQSGQIMNAAGLLKQKPHPSVEEIDQAMSGNICRCGTYNRIRAAIQQAAKKG